MDHPPDTRDHLKDGDQEWHVAPTLLHDTLDKCARNIRLAHILPQSEQIELRLEPVSLDDNPIYNALSYCWGDPKLITTI